MALKGEGEYNLDVLEETVVTDSYLGMDQNIRECQNKEPALDCSTRHYINNLVQKCGCLPFDLLLSDKTVRFKVHFRYKIIIIDHYE